MLCDGQFADIAAVLSAASCTLERGIELVEGRVGLCLRGSCGPLFAMVQTELRAW
jgi:hypothetical protein